MPQITINGTLTPMMKGQTILEVLRCRGIEVPHLCHDDRLKPFGGCRLCVVEVEGQVRPVPSCNTLVEEGMSIQTHTSILEESRRTLLGLMARQYPWEAFKRSPEKPFHHLLKQYGVENELQKVRQPGLKDESHPYIRVDMSQCIQCHRCVRICDEVQGQFVWKVWGRGDQTRILPDALSGRLLDSPCVSCGACVDTCPTGALEDKTLLEQGLPDRWTRTTCSYCGTGCEMNVGSCGERITTIRPVMDAPVSKGHLCVKGRYAFGFNASRDRMMTPMIRQGEALQPATWNEAIESITRKFQQIIERHGPDSVGILGSARATNEENYLIQKFSRLVLGTNNVDCCARVCHAPSAAGMKKILGTGAATNSFDDIEVARTILLCGANATENHPIVGARIKQAVLRGANLIVMDPREIELARYAEIHLALRPGTNVALLNAMACTIVEEHLVDSVFLSERVVDVDEFYKFIREWAPEKVAARCGVDAALIRRAARMYAAQKPAICFHGLGVTEHTQGTDGVMCLVNLALITGNLGRPGTGVNPLRGQNNVQGSAHMGCEPGSLTGFVSLEAGRDLFEGVWGRTIPKQPGLNLMQMIDAAGEGRLKALWAVGYDVLLTHPQSEITRKALQNLECLVVQDMFINETARLAHYFLPSASSFEKEGTFMNGERRVQRVRKVVPPPGEAKSDAEIICSVAEKMGFKNHFDFPSSEAIWEEIRKVWPGGAGITYARLEEGGIQWPCPSEDHPGTRILHGTTFSVGITTRLCEVAYRETPERTDADYPLLLTTGRSLYHFNSGTMTSRSLNDQLYAADFLDLSPEDAKQMGVVSGDVVEVSSHDHSILMPARIVESVKPGELFATFHNAKIYVNQLTRGHRDSVVGTPEYKVTAVRVRKIGK